MKKFKVGACSLALVIALGAAGCGSDDDSSGDEATTSDITKTEFVDQANQICADSNEAIASAAESELGANPSQEETEAFISDTVIPQVQSQADEIEALGAPEGDEDTVNAMLDALNSGIEEVESDPAAATSEDADPFAEANDLATEYGLADCAS